MIIIVFFRPCFLSLVLNTLPFFYESPRQRRGELSNSDPQCGVLLYKRGGHQCLDPNSYFHPAPTSTTMPQTEHSAQALGDTHAPLIESSSSGNVDEHTQQTNIDGGQEFISTSESEAQDATDNASVTTTVDHASDAPWQKLTQPSSQSVNDDTASIASGLTSDSYTLVDSGSDSEEEPEEEDDWNSDDSKPPVKPKQRCRCLNRHHHHT
ncbi:hypothetical protein F5878DRAFT_277827 [Lentinula raphanica]|uniref:Uncharacterized protein n=1 Tax=Lentinula raphanica TaxID=153919 RepID=A0AA38P4W7_9AGAR|nr:hypothetical protein F5878DRAFT_277827 [Lentinula raphanica]